MERKIKYGRCFEKLFLNKHKSKTGKYRILGLWKFGNHVLHFGFRTLMTLLPSCLTTKTLLMSFLQYLNSRHNNIEFTIEFEHHKEIPFFDILVKRGPNTIFKDLYL